MAALSRRHRTSSLILYVVCCVGGNRIAEAFAITRSTHNILTKHHGNADATNDTREPLFPERLNIIYDSKCSVCQWEVDNLTDLMSKLPSSSAQLIRFTDLEDGKYDESDPTNGGVTYEDGMRSFSAVRPDGTVIKGMAVFREAYELVDYGWVFGWTYNSWLRFFFDWGYKLFATIRTDLTRGSRVEDLIERHYAEAENCEPCKKKVLDV